MLETFMTGNRILVGLLVVSRPTNTLPAVEQTSRVKFPLHFQQSIVIAAKECLPPILLCPIALVHVASSSRCQGLEWFDRRRNCMAYLTSYCFWCCTRPDASHDDLPHCLAECRIDTC